MIHNPFKVKMRLTYMRGELFIINCTLVLIVITSLLAGNARADEFDYAKSLIQTKISCAQLNDSQLEQIGDYYMEQMHPGELHTIMENRLGGEGSESLRQAHIAMGKMFYCGDSSSVPYGMMNVMMGRAYNYVYNPDSYAGMMGGRGMIGNLNYGWNINYLLVSIIFILLIIVLVIWIIKLSKRK